MASAKQVKVPLESGSAHHPDTLVQTTQIVSGHHYPGAPIETAVDRDKREQVESEQGDIVAARPAQPGLVVSTSPEANLASRTNIVSDGPGTVGS